jgi:hypothetical protein
MGRSSADLVQPSFDLLLLILKYVLLFYKTHLMSRRLPQLTSHVQTLKNVCPWLYFLARESLLKGKD